MQTDIKPTFLISWFAASIVTLLSSIIVYIYLLQETYTPITLSNFHLYAALPNQHGFVTDSITKSDGRSKIVESFFQKYDSPLYHYSDIFIKIADRYTLDWRLLPSIAMQESNGGRRVIDSSFNPFGFGIYGSKVIRFNSWEEGIDMVGRALKEEYVDKGFKTPEQIMVKYTPPSLSNGGTWAKGVNSFMFELQ